MKKMNAQENVQGFVLLSDAACCVVTGGMSSSDFDKDLAYKFGEIMGIAFRVLYDLGENLFYKIKFTIIPSG